MTKQQPCASKLRLSKICRWLIALGIAKLALFGAWSVDMPLPQLIFPDKKASSTPAVPVSPSDKQPEAAVPAVLSPSARQTGEIRLAEVFAEGEEAVEGKKTAGRLSENSPAEKRAVSVSTVATSVAGVGEAAVRSTAPLPSMPVVPLPWSKAARTEAEAASAANSGERPLVSGVDADETIRRAEQEKSTDNNWWREIMTLTRLPVPVLGVLQVAHAAVMDTPPPPSRPAAAPGASPFAPPEQTQMLPKTPISNGQDPSGAPLPLRTRPNVPQTGTGTPAAQGTNTPTPSSVTGVNAPPAPSSSRAFLSPDSPERKQQELARREQDVLMLKQQMESRLQELQSTEKKVQGMLKEAHDVHDQKIKQLISAYTNMKPKQAALALESLDERLAARILAGMNPKQAGEVLTYTNPKTVAKLTELLARMQLPGE